MRRRQREGAAFINTDFPHDPRGSGFRDRPESGTALLALAGFIGLPLLVGAANAAATGGHAQGWYLSLTAPPAAAPGWLFGPAWTALSVLIGLAAWSVWRLRATLPFPPNRLQALRLWGWQLLANAAWVRLFFGLHAVGASLPAMAVLLGLMAGTVWAFWRRQRLAGCLLLPYVAWTCYAAYLTVGFWWLNPSA